MAGSLPPLVEPAAELTKEEVEVAEKRYPRMQWIVDMAKQYGAKKVLEVGVGNAVCSMMLVRAGIKVVGIDIEPSRVQGANFGSVQLDRKSVV